MGSINIEHDFVDYCELRGLSLIGDYAKED
jgi:hypothetical protein